MGAGKFNKHIVIEQLDAGGTPPWTQYSDCWAQIFTTGESGGHRTYQVITPWTPRKAAIQGLITLDEGFRVNWLDNGQSSYLRVMSALDEENRRRELVMLCDEVVGTASANIDDASGD